MVVTQAELRREWLQAPRARHRSLHALNVRAVDFHYTNRSVRIHTLQLNRVASASYS